MRCLEPIPVSSKFTGVRRLPAARVVVCAALYALFAGLTASGERAEHVTPRPHMFVTGQPVKGLRSLDDVRKAIRTGHAAALWNELLDKVKREAQEEAWTPATALPGRGEAQIKHANRDFSIVAMTANRILDASLAALITDKRTYADAALTQLDALFDPEQWPDWEDKAHVEAGLITDLRHGQLAFAVSVSYDWLYDLLRPEERKRIIDGLDRCAIQRYKAGIDAKESWTRNRTNWMTVVVGGFGIAGMALGEDHPDSEFLVDFARPRMESYLEVAGPDGEFNESVQYAGSMLFLVRYFTAVRYASGGLDNPFDRHSLAEFCRWYLYMTFPPGRVAGFGDPAPDMPPVVNYISAVAAATRDPLLQWFYLQYCDMMLETHRNLAMELLYYDATLDAKSPEGRLPLGRAYHHQGKLISSRSSWDPVSTPSVVYAKASRESTHSHADWGQVCIDGFGERLLIDLGSPPGYPKSHKERYYNYQQWGHNVFVFGKNDTGGIPWAEQKREGRIAWAEFDDTRGAAWTMDLTAIYDGVKTVTRTVVHLLPRVAVVLDSAALQESQPISMRWHLAAPANPGADGGFHTASGRAKLAGLTARIDGDATVRSGRHAYEAPYNRDRLGEIYPQRHEPYIEVAAEDDACRVLSLFCVYGPDDIEDSWKTSPKGWSIETPEGLVRVQLEENKLTVECAETGKSWSVVAGPTGKGSS